MSEQERYRELAMMLVSEALARHQVGETPVAIKEEAMESWDETMKLWDANAKVATSILGDDKGFKVDVGFPHRNKQDGKYVYVPSDEAAVGEDMRLIHLAVAQEKAEKALRDAMEEERKRNAVAEALWAEEAKEQEVEYTKLRGYIRTAHVDELVAKTGKSREEVIASQGHVNVVELRDD